MVEAWVIQLVWAVEPLVREPGLGKRGPVSLDPLVVSDARGQVVHYIQELEFGSVNKHDATVLLRSEDAFVLCHHRDKVLADELEIVVARIEADHRHLVDPVHDEIALGCGGFPLGLEGSTALPHPLRLPHGAAQAIGRRDGSTRWDPWRRCTQAQG